MRIMRFRSLAFGLGSWVFGLGSLALGLWPLTFGKGWPNVDEPGGYELKP